MGVKFLSEEWAASVQAALNANEAFRSQATSTTASVQQIVQGGPEGEQRYWFKLEGAEAHLGTGDAQGPVDATITQDYETAVGLMKNEVSGMAAYMSGKLRVSGDLMKLMQLQGVLAQMPVALKDLEVDY
ncbi:MAG: SCP2 sterol-binding domain-containing protein [Actinobacteria bacterium]|nr:SCP2 sterol-binding domain-containing protein [Actinomycetota bacterium]